LRAGAIFFYFRTRAWNRKTSVAKVAFRLKTTFSAFFGIESEKLRDKYKKQKANDKHSKKNALYSGKNLHKFILG
jgi:hypothetical protein